ncbi:MAG: TIM barrel protein [Anaerolineales bacterium]
MTSASPGAARPMTQDGFAFGTVGSPISTPKKPGGTVGGIAQMARLRLGALELAWVRSVRVSEAKCLEIRIAAETHHIALSVHAPYFINLNAGQDEWPKSRKRLMDAAHYGNLAGASDIVFHPGSYFGAPAEQVLRVAVPRLAACLEEIRRSGNPVILRPETMGKSAMLGSLEDTLVMAAEVPGVLPCLDFAHLHARPGDGSANSYDEWRRMIDLCATTLGDAGLRRMHIHLSGIAYGPKGEKHHLAFAKSKLRYRDLLRALRDSGAVGRILCESPLMEKDAKVLQRAWARVRSAPPV